MDHPPPRAAARGRSPKCAVRPARRATRTVLALCSSLLILSSCGVLPFPLGPATSTPTEAVPVVGRSVVDVPVDLSSGTSGPDFGADLPRAFASGADYDEWRVTVARAHVPLGGGVLQAEFGPLEVDDSAEVVVAAVYDSCDAEHRFVSTESSVILSETFDATPEDSYVCETAQPRLAVLVVELEEIGASSPADVGVR